MIKTIALVAVAALAALLLYAATRPDTFRVQRSARILASADKIHPLINELSRFNTWNPYARKDPNMKGSYRGPTSGPGAGYDFEGNKEVGKGSIQIVESARPTRVTMKLDMIEPFEGHNTVEFTLAPRGDATEVTWAMHGASPFVARLMGLFFDMDGMIGNDFEAGLANLKAVAERP
ncbi:SRPBCC family protein [Piscinibacter sp.]|jgi:hypothetical protein|uniref:SRPBCC family protein n=1 Tax=Piscinibacter sp. TaxID=1903157 RepID=UPI00355A5367